MKTCVILLCVLVLFSLFCVHQTTAKGKWTNVIFWFYLTHIRYYKFVHKFQTSTYFQQNNKSNEFPIKYLYNLFYDSFSVSSSSVLNNNWCYISKSELFLLSIDTKFYFKFISWCSKCNLNFHFMKQRWRCRSSRCV